MVVRFTDDDTDNMAADAIAMNYSYINYRIMFISLSILLNRLIKIIYNRKYGARMPMPTSMPTMPRRRFEADPRSHK
jgi:hypothetical protein